VQVSRLVLGPSSDDMVAIVFVFASFLAAVCAKPALRNVLVHEQRQSVPNGFVSRGAAPLDKTLSLRIQLAQTDMEGLERALYDASMPTSSFYGQYLTKEEVCAI
jgi:tripeptidyl-peptidase-1